jgi:hypothetical protein
MAREIAPEHMTSLDPNQRLDELLDLDALAGLPAEEARELERLSASVPPQSLSESRFARERAAAALVLALTAGKPRLEPPKGFEQRLRGRLQKEIEAARAGTGKGPATGSGVVIPLQNRNASGPRPTRRSWLTPLGFGLAAAAAALWFFSTQDVQRLRSSEQSGRMELAQVSAALGDARRAAGTERQRAETAESGRARLEIELRDVIAERDRLRSELDSLRLERADRLEELALARGELADLRIRLAESEDRSAVLKGLLEGPDEQLDLNRLLTLNGTIRIPWNALSDPLVQNSEVSGELVWNSDEGRGYMRFSGLPENDPGQMQYQLWIFDRSLSDATPIDGGVFDIRAAADQLVAIDPKIAVQEAWRFAITLERPGGVVVSDRSRLLLLADA